jgi:23S rRNA pseudouridine2605 synthase
MREKEYSGKKPVRRSKSDEKETPRTYTPRTAKIAGAEPKKRRDLSGDDSESRSSDAPTRGRERRDDREDTKRPARRSFGSESSSTKRGSKESKGTTYKPRTLKRSTSDKEKEETRKEERFERPERSERSERHQRSERSDRPERSQRSERPEISQRSDRPERSDRYKSTDRPERTDRREKSDRYGKSERPPRSDRNEKTGRFERSDRFKKDKDSGRDNRSGKSYHEDKFSKPSKDSFKKVAKSTSKPPQIDADLKTDKDGLIRLNKYIANSGLCSRREADDYIVKGQITVNGIEVKELGTKVKLTDEVRFKDKALDPEKKVYILLNKPKDYVTTVEDPNATHTVMELIEDACEQRVYPVGRLDRNSTGLLLFTNDGELTKQLTHPSFMKKKIYEVGLEKNVRPEDMDAIRAGIDLEGEIIAADAIEYTDDNDKSVIGIEIHSGQNRIVRRIFENLGYRVQKLDRVYFAGLTKKNLPRGKWRFLSAKEVEMLKMNRFE